MYQEFAVLRHQEKLYVARSPRNSLPLGSAAVVLIQGIYARYPEQARRMLRQRILTSLAPNPLLEGMVKVSAKRVTYSLSQADYQREVRNDEFPIELLSDATIAASKPDWRAPEGAMSDADWLAQASALKKMVERAGPLYASDRPIAAVLVGPDGRMLDFAVNTNAQNKTLHAEINLLQAFCAQTQKLIPPGSKIITTLKPCKMCAGAILTCAEDASKIQVIYGENDPGRHGQNTALDRYPEKIQRRLDFK